MVPDNTDPVQRTEDYEVISLYDLITILLKRKLQIFLVFFLCVVLAVAGSLMMKPVYRTSSALSPGWIMDTEGNIKYVESPQNLSAIISKGSFNSQVMQKLGWDPSDLINNFIVQTDLPKNTSTVYLSIDSGNTERALEYMNALINYLIDYYGERTRVITGKIKNDITVSERKLEVLKKTEERLQLQLKDMQKNTADILRHRDALLTDEDKTTDTLSLLLYSNTIQQNVSYMDQLYQLIEENGMQQKDLQQNIGDLMLQLSRGGKSTGKDILDKGQFEGLIVVQKPIVDPKRVKPNRTLMVALAGVLGLFLGVFVAFFREFWENQKELRAQA